MTAPLIATKKEECAPSSDAFALSIDLVHLSRQTMGDAALEAELLRLFDRQAHNIVSQLEIEIISKETHELQKRLSLAHALKGSARAVGAFGVAEAAERLETASRPDGSELRRLFRELKVATGRAQKDIASLMQ